MRMMIIIKYYYIYCICSPKDPEAEPKEPGPFIFNAGTWIPLGKCVNIIVVIFVI